MHIPEEDENVGITGEVTIASLPPRLTARVGSSVGVGNVLDEVV